jgi:hypothetical protein
MPRNKYEPVGFGYAHELIANAKARFEAHGQFVINDVQFAGLGRSELTKIDGFTAKLGRWLNFKVFVLENRFEDPDSDGVPGVFRSLWGFLRHDTTALENVFGPGPRYRWRTLEVRMEIDPGRFRTVFGCEPPFLRSELSCYLDVDRGKLLDVYVSRALKDFRPRKGRR